jgi:hypothetical protein
MPLILTEEHTKQLVIGLQYDANESLHNMVKWRGTIFSFVIFKSTAWVLIAIHVTFWACWHYHTCQDLEGKRIEGCTTTREFLKANFYPPSLRDLAPLIGAFTFGMIFYLQSSYVIYRDFYFNGHQIAGNVKNITILLRAVLRRKEGRWNVARHLISSQRILYWEVRKRRAEWHGDLPGEHNHPGVWNDWAPTELGNACLMTPEEMAYVGTFSGNKHMLLYSWAIEQLRDEIGAPLLSNGQRAAHLRSESDEAHFVTQCCNQILPMRDNTARLHQMLLVPIPFPYYHLVETMVFFVLLLMAYSFINLNGSLESISRGGDVDAASHISLFVFPITVLVTNGMIEMANMMQDPLGDDIVDFNQRAYMNDLYDLAEAQCLHTGSRSKLGVFPPKIADSTGEEEYRSRSFVVKSKQSDESGSGKNVPAGSKNAVHPAAAAIARPPGGGDIEMGGVAGTKSPGKRRKKVKDLEVLQRMPSMKSQR